MGVKFFRREKKTAHFKHNGRTFKDPKKIRPAGYARNKASRLCRKQVNRICVNGAKKKKKNKGIRRSRNKEGHSLEQLGATN